MSDKELTFWDHLDELRRVLFRILGVWFILAVGYFIAMPYLFDNVVLAPCHDDFIFYDLLRRIMRKCKGKSQEVFIRELERTYESLVRERNLTPYCGIIISWLENRLKIS